MKKHILGMIMAGAAVLSACEANVKPELIDETSDAIVFTASLGKDTKTYLDYDADAGVYKTKWAAGDAIAIMALQEDQTYDVRFSTISSGSGTTEGTFRSSARGIRYIGYYGNYSTVDDLSTGTILPYYLQYQYDRNLTNSDGTTSFSDYVFPMYAEGDSNHFEFKNLGAVLKMSLLGTDYIDNIVVRANVPISGAATIVPGNDDAPLHTVMIDSLSQNSITYYLRDYLSETEAKDCYIVLPAQTYTGGLEITINSAIGSMTKTISGNVVFERSQLRAIPAFTYVNEEMYNISVIGSMTGWSEDLDLDIKDNLFVGEITLNEDDEFKFRANYSWDYNLGSNDTIVLGEPVKLVPDGPNMKVPVAGNYRIELNLAEKTAIFTLLEEDIPFVETYDDLGTYENGSIVKVQGYVLANYARGFILNLNGEHDNSVLVYQGTDQSMYAPVIGNIVELIAEKTIYNGHLELKNIQYINVLDSSEQNWTANYYYNFIGSPASFDAFAYDRPVYVRFEGILEKSGNYWNIVVDGATRKGTLEFPYIDLTEYIGEPLVIDGWFIGTTSNETSSFFKVVFRQGYRGSNNVDGGNEDVTPGDDLIPDGTEVAM